MSSAYKAFTAKNPILVMFRRLKYYRWRMDFEISRQDKTPLIVKEAMNFKRKRDALRFHAEVRALIMKTRKRLGKDVY